LPSRRRAAALTLVPVSLAPVRQPVERAAAPAAAVTEAQPVAVAAADTAVPRMQPLASMESASPQDPLPAPAAAPLAGDDFDGYVPRPLLSVAPVLQTAVLLDFPEDSGVADGRYTEVLTLYIDETGAVRKVEPEGHDLPPALEAVARAAFLGARFEPGQVEGAIVKSRIRIAVEFESRASATSRRF